MVVPALWLADLPRMNCLIDLIIYQKFGICPTEKLQTANDLSYYKKFIIDDEVAIELRKWVIDISEGQDLREELKDD